MNPLPIVHNIKSISGNIISTYKEVAETFNDHFSSIASDLNTNISSNNSVDPGGFLVPESLYLKPAEPSEVYAIIIFFIKLRLQKLNR